MNARQAARAAWGLFSALLLLLMGHGLLGVLLGVRSELEGFSTTITGVIMAGYFGGFLLGSQLAPRLMTSVGHIRAFTGLSSVAAAVALLHPFIVAPFPWLVLRFIFGLALSGLFVVSESWLNDSVTNETRGRLMAIYMVVSMGAVGLGQLIFGAGDPLADVLFMVVGIFVVLSVVPISLSQTAAPPISEPPSVRRREIWTAAPLGIITALLGGVVAGALLGMAGVYGTQEGLSTAQVAMFAGAAAFGAVALQLPIGLASDLIGRRPTILVATALASAVGLSALMITPDSFLMVAAMFLMGGLTFSLYSLALSHIVDVLPSGQAATGSMAVLFTSGIGAIAGPLLASFIMEQAGPSGFWVTIAAAHGLIALYALVRFVRLPRIADVTPEPYVAVPARSTYPIGGYDWVDRSEES